MTTTLKLLLVLGVGLVIGVIIDRAFGARATRPVPTTNTAATPSAAPTRKLLYYRHPMGLGDNSPVPKKDEMGMDYVAVYEDGAPKTTVPTPGLVSISPEKIQTLGVTTTEVVLRSVTRSVRSNGVLRVDETGMRVVAPRFEGWIERLVANQTGQVVRRGDPLMYVYSPELVSAQREYLIASSGTHALAEGEPAAQRGLTALRAGALDRLRNWGVAEGDVRAITSRVEALHTLPVRSPVDGIVLEKMAVEGMRFMPGETLFRIGDLSRIWVIAEVFEQDLGAVRLEQDATIFLDAFPTERFSGRVTFIAPQINAETRTARVRLELANPGLRLKPDMYARVEFVADKSPPMAAVPNSAILDSGKHRVVLVDQGQGRFEPREVQTGVQADGFTAIESGVASGERVVTSANFLIDAESNLNAALGSLGGHAAHGGQAPAKADQAPKPDAVPQNSPGTSTDTKPHTEHGGH